MNKEKGWELNFVISELAIPEELRTSFYETLGSPPSQYRLDLDRAIRNHGVRWEKDVTELNRLKEKL